MILGATSVYKCDKGLFARGLCVLKCVHRCVQKCVQCVQGVTDGLQRKDAEIAEGAKVAEGRERQKSGVLKVKWSRTGRELVHPTIVTRRGSRHQGRPVKPA